MVHKTLEQHVKDLCQNSNCRKKRNGEDLESTFSGPKHYVIWECEDCGEENWFEAKMSSHVEHMNKL